MIIGTFNVQNKYFLKNYNGKNIKNNPRIFNEMLKEYQIDILGTQELVKGYLENLNQEINKQYQILGGYRFPKGLFKKFNETNSIITKQPILKCETKHLPFLPTLLPRIVTIAHLHTKEAGTICFMNTHLSFANRKVQKRQLETLQKMIASISIPIILTGDFNLTIHNPIFKNFITELQRLHLKRIPIHEKTYKKHTKERSIDHIFIPESWEIDSFQVIKDAKFDDFSDHYLIVAKIHSPK